MASVHSHKPVDQINHQSAATKHCHKPNNESACQQNGENKFSNKVKEMANSACKMFTDKKKKDGNCFPRLTDHKKKEKPMIQKKKNKEGGKSSDSSSSDSEDGAKKGKH